MNNDDFRESLDKLADRAKAWSATPKAAKAFAKSKIKIMHTADAVGKISKIDPDLLRKRVTL